MQFVHEFIHILNAGSDTPTFQDPSNPHSLSDNHVRTIIEDGDGALWLATRAGLNRFDPQTEQFTSYRASSDDPSGLLNDSIWGLHIDSRGMIWIGTPVSCTCTMRRWR